MQEFKATLTDDELKAVLNLAAKRGVDANTVLQQAIATEKILDESVGANDELLIKKNDNTFSKVVFDGETPA